MKKYDTVDPKTWTDAPGPLKLKAINTGAGKMLLSPNVRGWRMCLACPSVPDHVTMMLSMPDGDASRCSRRGARWRIEVIVDFLFSSSFSHGWGLMILTRAGMQDGGVVVAEVQADLEGHGITVETHDEINMYQSTKKLEIIGKGFQPGTKVRPVTLRVPTTNWRDIPVILVYTILLHAARRYTWLASRKPKMCSGGLVRYTGQCCRRARRASDLVLDGGIDFNVTHVLLDASLGIHCSYG